MTAVPRDPAFWKRFSAAARLDEEKGKALKLDRPSVDEDGNPTQSWLDTQYKKRRRNRCCLCFSSLVLVGSLAFFTLALVYLGNHGWYMHGEKFEFP